MESKTDTKIGAKLLELRKKKGLTQEQLAEQLGISAPAVSKWENDSSYPDITLLCPLARALDTNVDTLLQFEEKLTDKEIVEKVEDIIIETRKHGYEAGEKMLWKLLHKYPNDDGLKLNAALVWDVFQMFFPSEDEKTRRKWETSKKQLLKEVRASATGACLQNALLQLAQTAMQENNLEQAEQLLKELPEQTVETGLLWSRLYLKKEQPQEALKILQKRLLYHVQQMQMCLCAMQNPDLIPDCEQELKICEVYQAVDELFGCGGMSDGLFLEIYLRMKRMKEAAESLEKYVEALTGPGVRLKPFLFSPAFQKEQKNALESGRELCRMLVKALEDEQYQPLFQYPNAKSAYEKLKNSLTA